MQNITLFEVPVSSQMTPARAGPASLATARTGRPGCHAAVILSQAEMHISCDKGRFGGFDIWPGGAGPGIAYHIRKAGPENAALRDQHVPEMLAQGPLHHRSLALGHKIRAPAPGRGLKAWPGQSPFLTPGLKRVGKRRATSSPARSERGSGSSVQGHSEDNPALTGLPGNAVNGLTRSRHRHCCGKTRKLAATDTTPRIRRHMAEVPPGRRAQPTGRISLRSSTLSTCSSSCPRRSTWPPSPSTA